MNKTETAKILLSGLVKPKNWTDPAPAIQLRVEIEKYFSLPMYPVNSGRSALYLILRAANIGSGDEVLIQAYTCNAVPNPVIWTGAKPIYADIDPETLNVDPEDLKKKITSKTKAIILQHTFGRPGPIKEVLEIAKSHHLLVIEDCAHSLGAEYEGKKLGTFGDAAILSFGREKVVSSLAGGAILVRNVKLIKPLEEEIKNLNYTPFSEFIKEINNFFVWRLLIRKVFFTNFGKSLLKRLNNLNFFNVVYTKEELVGERPERFPALYPGTLAEVALSQFKNVDEINASRNKLAAYYEKNIKNKDFRLLSHHVGVYLRFVVFHKAPSGVFEEARKRKFWFGDWYNTPVYPKKTNLEKVRYVPGSCPNAESIAYQTINLPIYQGMTAEEAEKIVGFINLYK